VISPLLRRLSDRSVDQEILLRQGKQLQQKQQQQRYAGGSAAAPTPGAAAAAAGIEAAKINVDRQILLTTLLAHMCASNDATPRTFVEQVGGVEAWVGGRVRGFPKSTQLTQGQHDR